MNISNMTDTQLIILVYDVFEQFGVKHSDVMYWWDSPDWETFKITDQTNGFQYLTPREVFELSFFTDSDIFLDSFDAWWDTQLMQTEEALYAADLWENEDYDEVGMYLA